MSIIMNESLGSLEYDGLINSAYPADIIHATLASGYGKLSRGYLIAKAANGSLIPWGSDITDDLSEALTTTAHVATKVQAGLDATKLKVYATDFIEETLEVTEYAATKNVAGLDNDTLVVKNGEDTLTITTDYTVTYEDDVLTITLVDTGGHYAAEALDIRCFFADTFALIEKTTDYTTTYTANTLIVTLVVTSNYYDAPTVKVVCPYAYAEGTIAGGNLILADDVDTGAASGSTVVARAYRTGIFNQNKLLYNAKALGGITDITKEKLRSLGILLNHSIS